MKKSIFSAFLWLAALTAALSLNACADDLGLTPDAPALDGEQLITLSLDVPDAMTQTRAAAASAVNSANGGLTNVDMDSYDLRYQVAVYRVDATTDGVSYVKVIDNQKQVFDRYQATTYQLRLTPGRDYRVVAWADFIEHGSEDDLHYQTADLTAITLAATGAHLNDESRDAFFASESLSVGSTTADNGFSLGLTLRRPFAKVRVVTTDWNMYSTLEMPDRFRITYNEGTRFFAGINLLTGEAQAATDIAEATRVVHTGELTTYTAGRDAATADGLTGARQRTLTVDYLMQDVYAETSQSPIHFLLEALRGDEETEVARYDFETDIPVRRNWLTTIVGNFLTVDATFDVEIDDNFEDEYIKDNIGRYFYGNSPLYTNADGTPIDGYTHVPCEKPSIIANAYQIRTAAELAWISEHNDDVKASGYDILLMNDIDLRHIYWSPIDIASQRADDGTFDSPVAESQTFDGQGFTIRNLTLEGQNDNAGLFGNSEIAIKNVTLENVYFYNTKLSAGALSGSHKEGAIENCHVRHFFIRNAGYSYPDKPNHMTEYHPTGGLVGRISNSSLTDCTAYDIDIQNSTATGAIAGQSTNVDFVRCSVEKASIWLVRFIMGADNFELGEHLGHSHDALSCDKAPAASLGFWFPTGGKYVWYEISDYAGTIVGTYLYAETESEQELSTVFTDCAVADVTFKYSDHADFDNVVTLTVDNQASFEAGADARFYTWFDLSLSGEALEEQTYLFGPHHHLYGQMNPLPSDND